MLRITLTNPIAAPDINLLTDRESKIISPIFRINSYRFKKNFCNINDEKQFEKLSCTYDELKPVYSIGDSFKTINNLSENSYIHTTPFTCKHFHKAINKIQKETKHF